MHSASRNALASLLSALAALLPAACAVGPNYKRPEAPVPAAFKEASAEGPAPGEWKKAEPRDAAARGKWWEIYGDPILNQLEEQVAVGSQTIALAVANYEASRAVARGARSAFFPQLTAGASVNRQYPVLPRGSTEPTTANTFSASGDVSWELDVWGRIRRSVEANVAGAQASAADLESARLLTQAELAADYFALRGFEDQKKLVDENVEAYEKALELTVKRYRQGVVSGVDVAQAETQLYSTRTQSADLELSRAQTEHAIAVLLGTPPAGFSVPPSTAVRTPPAIPLTLPSELLERRPDIAGAERRVASANAQVGVAEAAFFPTLLLAATGGFEAASIARWFNWPSRFWSLGASLVGTVFDAGKRKAATEQAVAFYDGSVASYRQTVLSAFQDVEDNLAALRLLSEESRFQTNAVAAARRSVTLARNRYEGGITTYLEVVTAQTTDLLNERAAVIIETQRMTASVNLVRALGGGWQASNLPDSGTVLSSGKPAGSDTATAAKSQ
jgi:NodT family efflux transporter outer membrane factor (OMF) lipoprotein